MKKRILCLFLAVLLALGSIPSGVFAEVAEPETSTPAEDFTYTVTSSTTCSITGYTGDDTRIVIPSVIDGYEVTSIGIEAFSGCTSLTSISIPDSVISIDGFAFWGCTSLKSITIPSSVTTISVGVFWNCKNLSEIKVAQGNQNYSSDEQGLLYNNGKSILICCPEGKNVIVAIPDGVTSIGSDAFYGCTSLTGVTIPDSVTSIGSNAFSGCESLTSITIPDSVTSIGSGAFYGCTSLTGVTIPDSVTSIGSDAFYGCTSLTGVTIPDSVTSIGSGAFSGCESLTSITIPEGVTSIGSRAFYGCTSLTGVTIPNSVTSIGSGAFSCCTSLESIDLAAENKNYIVDNQGILFDKEKTKLIICPAKKTGSVIIPDGVTNIEQYAFYGCTSLTGVTIPDSVTSIGSDAFYGCESLTSITIPEGVTSIGSGAFYGCTSLTGVTIPNSVTSIGSDAFRGCTSLTGVTIPDSVTSIGFRAFYGCTSLTGVTIPDSVTSIGDHAFFLCTGLSEIKVSSGNENYSSDEQGILYDNAKTKLIICPGGKTGAVIIPDSVTKIAGFAFSCCASLTSITIPDGVTSISHAYMTSGNGVYSYSMFSSCTELSEIKVDPKNENYSSDEQGILYNKSKTELICCPGGKTGAVEIPDSVTSINRHSFFDCMNLTNVTIPGSVTIIDSYAFYNCTSLTDIVFLGDVPSISFNSFGGSSGRVIATATYPAGNSTWTADKLQNYGGTITWVAAANDCSVLGHVEEIIPGKPSNCMQEGLTEGVKCSVCDEILVAQQTIPKPATGHTMGDWSIMEEFECGEEYTEIRTCQNGCGYSETRDVPATGDHAWGSWINISNATCVSEGKNVRYCKNCNLEQESIIPVMITMHSYTMDDEYVVDKAPTCTEAGSKSIHCGLCNEIMTHTTLEIPALGDEHSWGEWVENKNGTETKTCTVCGSSETRIPDHQYGDIVQQGTCGENLTWTLDSNGLLTVYGEGIMPPLDHQCAPWVPFKDQILYVLIEEGVTSVSYGSFQACSSIVNVYLPDSIETIDSSAFGECLNLTSITIPERVTSVGASAFWGCSSLKAVIFLGDAPEINETAFYCILTTATYPRNNDTWTSDKLQNYGGMITWVKAAPEIIDSGKCNSNISWTLDIEGTLTISGSGQIPGHPIGFSLAPLYEVGQRAEKVVICEGITGTALWALYGSSMKSIEFPSTMTYIGEESFYDCDNLVEVIVPDGVTEIGSAAFADCESLSRIDLPSTLRKLNPSVFSCCPALEELIIPEGIEVLSNSMFYIRPTYGSSVLRYVDIPDSVKTIEYNAFYNCTSLEGIKIPANVENIGKEAFYNCSSLDMIKFSGNAPEIDSTAFTGVTATATYPAGNETWTADKLQNYGGTITWKEASPEILSSGTCGENLTWNLDDYGLLTISGTGAMADFSWGNAPWSSYKTDIKNIVINDGVTTIGEHAFTECSSIEAVTIADGVSRIGMYAFSYSAVKSITIPEGVTSIGMSAFVACSSLTEITLPKSLTSLDIYAFQYCDNLTDVYFAGTESDWQRFSSSMGNEVLASATVHYVKADDGIVDSGTCGENLTWTLDGEGTLTISGTGAMDDYEFMKTPWNEQRYDIKAVVIENGVTSIGDYAFYECDKMAEIIIPEGVTSIGVDSLYMCSSLTSIDLPESLTSIKDNAFFACTKLTSITFPESVSTIGYAAFSYCHALEEIVFLGDAPAFGSSFGSTVFWEVTTTATYPAGNETWTEDKLQDYGGTITWGPAAHDCSANGHVYESVLTEPTCTEDGYTTYTCTVCEYSYTDGVVVKTGHTVVTDDAVLPTCVSNGMSEEVTVTCVEKFCLHRQKFLQPDIRRSFQVLLRKPRSKTDIRGTKSAKRVENYSKEVR